MAQKPSTLKGTRDFGPDTVQRRNYMIDIIRHHFEHYGFMPIETPSFEHTDTLLGKYGEEGDRLIFKILNNGQYLNKVKDQDLIDKNESIITPQISKRALRYDLTVPFARYVAQHQNEINFPFKRYQIQPVWRADRPQKGRFQEFYQCDADLVGSDSLWSEVELIKLYDNVFTDLKLTGCTIKINNRKILAAIAQLIGAQDQIIDFTIALDKLDKIGVENVKQEMIDKGIPPNAVQQLEPIFQMQGDFAQQLTLLHAILAHTDQGKQGISELNFIHHNINNLGLKSATLQLDITLARGLNYYTGCIFEVTPPQQVQIGSIGGGGRYDDLTSIFGLKDMSGVGISFGLDRIYITLHELNLFPDTVRAGVDALFINFGHHESVQAMSLLYRFRESGIKTELYPEPAKTQKQMKYADRNTIPYVILMGENEIASNKLLLKNMKDGSQQSLSVDDTIQQIKLINKS